MTQAAIPAQPTRVTPSTTYALVLLCGLGMFNAGDRLLLNIMLDPIKHDLGVSDTAMGLLTGIGFAACYFVAGIPLAMWSDRGVRRDVAATCLAVWSIMTALCGFAQNFIQIAAARAGVAIGEAGGSPAVHSMVMDLYPPTRRAGALAAIVATQALGIGVGLALGGWLSAIFTWRTVFMLACLPGLAWALLLRLTVREPLRGASDLAKAATSKGPLLQSLAELWRLKSLRALFVLASVAAVTGNMILTWSPVFFMRVHHMTAGQLGYKIGFATAFGLIVGNVLAGKLCDLLGPRNIRWYMRIAAFGCVAAALPFLVFLFASNTTVALAALSLAQLLETFFMAPLFTMALTLSPVKLRATTSMALGAALYVIGLGLGPLIIGMLNDALTPTHGAEAVRFSLLATVVGLVLCGLTALAVNRWLPQEINATRPAA